MVGNKDGIIRMKIQPLIGYCLKDGMMDLGNLDGSCGSLELFPYFLDFYFISKPSILQKSQQFFRMYYSVILYETIAIFKTLIQTQIQNFFERANKQAQVIGWVFHYKKYSKNETYQLTYVGKSNFTIEPRGRVGLPQVWERQKFYYMHIDWNIDFFVGLQLVLFHLVSITMRLSYSVGIPTQMVGNMENIMGDMMLMIMMQGLIFSMKRI